MRVLPSRDKASTIAPFVCRSVHASQDCGAQRNPAARAAGRDGPRGRGQAGQARRADSPAVRRGRRGEARRRGIQERAASPPTRIEMVRDADIVLSVQPPELPIAQAMKEGAILISFVYANKEPELTRLLRERKITCFAMELVPRITRAQAMDALVQPGGAGRVLRGAARRDQHRAHAADDDDCRRLDPSRPRAGDGARRRRPAGTRDGASPRRDDRRLRRASGNEGAGRIARRELRRYRRRCARYRRLCARADAGREGQSRRGRHQAHPAAGHRHHHRRDSRAGPRRSSSARRRSKA